MTNNEQELQAVTDAWKREIEEVKRLKAVNRKLIAGMKSAQQALVLASLIDKSNMCDQEVKHIELLLKSV